MSYANIYKVTTEIAGHKSKTYVIARSFGEAISLAGEKDDKVTRIKCVAEKVPVHHLLKEQVPALPDFPDSETSK